MNLQRRKVIAILGAEDFGEEIIPKLEEIIVTRLNQGEALYVNAGIDGDSEVFRLFCRLSERYQSVIFFAVLSNDGFLNELIRSGKGDLIKNGLISFEITLSAETPEKAKKLRDISITGRSDTIICLRGSRFDDPGFIERHLFNRKIEIIAL